MHWNALQKLIWSIILWSFFDYCSSTAAFSIIVSVLRCLLGDKSWLSWEPKLDRNQYTAVVEQFYYILETFPNLNLSISAKHQILCYIWSSRKLCNVQGLRTHILTIFWPKIEDDQVDVLLKTVLILFCTLWV